MFPSNPKHFAFHFLSKKPTRPVVAFWLDSWPSVSASIRDSFGYVKRWFLKYYNQYTWVGFHPLYKPNQQKRFWIICSPDSSIFFLPPRYSDAVKKGFALVAGIVGHWQHGFKSNGFPNALNERCGFNVLSSNIRFFFTCADFANLQICRVVTVLAQSPYWPRCWQPYRKLCSRILLWPADTFWQQTLVFHFLVPGYRLATCAFHDHRVPSTCYNIYIYIMFKRIQWTWRPYVNC